MQETDRQEETGSTRLLVAVVLTYLLAQSGTNLMPFIVGSLIDHRDLDSAAVGLLGSGELAGLAVAAVGLASFVAHGRRRAWLLAGAGVAGLGHGVSSIELGYTTLLASRATAGLGEGMLMAVAMAAVAGARDPTRLFAQVTAIVYAIMAVQFMALPPFVATFGPEGIFAALAIMTLLLGALAAVWIPDAPATAETVIVATEPSSHRKLALPGIAAVVIAAIGQMMIWVLSERLGVLAGLSAEGIGIVLAVVLLAAIVGAAAAAWLGTRRGSVLPAMLGLAGFAVAALAMVQVNQVGVYIASNILFGATYAFFTPYFMGALAALDRTGRWTATGGGAQMVGLAIGPLLGGVLVSVGWWSVSLLILVSMPIAFALLWPLLRFVDRGTDDDAGVPVEDVDDAISGSSKIA